MQEEKNLVNDLLVKAAQKRPNLGAQFEAQYEIEGPIKAGGWGVIYKARQVAFDRQVAVKVLHPNMLDDESGVSRFKREARAAANIKSKYIATVYDSGVLESGSPYIVMQYFDGCDLSEYLRKHGPMKAEEAIAVFRELAAALHIVHSHDIVHRDIKPANILMIENDKGIFEPKLIDFGLVGLVRTGGRHTQITATGMVVGTPAYMSPEQCLGHKCDDRSDVYSLGCTMYEALTGTNPFSNSNTIECMTRHLSGNVPPPTMQADQERVADQLTGVLYKSLAKDRDQRMVSMQELSDDLGRCLTGDALAGDYRPETGPAQVVAVSSKNRETPKSGSGALLHATAAVIAFLAICVGIGWYLSLDSGPKTVKTATKPDTGDQPHKSFTRMALEEPTEPTYSNASIYYSPPVIRVAKPEVSLPSLCTGVGGKQWQEAINRSETVNYGRFYSLRDGAAMLLVLDLYVQNDPPESEESFRMFIFRDQTSYPRPGDFVVGGDRKLANAGWEPAPKVSYSSESATNSLPTKSSAAFCYGETSGNKSPHLSYTVRIPMAELEGRRIFVRPQYTVSGVIYGANSGKLHRVEL